MKGNRKITPLDRIRSRALRIAMTAFRADPSLGARQAKSLFAEIVAYLRSGMNEEAVVEQVLKSQASEMNDRAATAILSLF